MSITTTSYLAPPILQSLAEQMLSVPTPNFNYIIPAHKQIMPRNGGTTLRNLRPVPLVPPVVQLGNSGLEPASQILSREIIDSVMAQYGTSVILNEQVTLQSQDPILAWGTERLAVAVRQAEDIILRDFLLSVASVYNCRGGVNGDNPTEATPRDISNVGTRLNNANAFQFEEGIEGQDKFATSPIRQAFLLLCNTQLRPTFDAMDKFTPKWNYPSMTSTIPSELGVVYDMRILMSSQAAVQQGVSMLGNDVFNNMAVARMAYSHIEQDGYSNKLMYRPPIFSGPMGLNSSLAATFWQSQCLLQSTWITNFRCTQIS